MADVALGEPTHVPATPPPVFELADVWTTRVDKRACSLLVRARRPSVHPFVRAPPSSSSSRSTPSVVPPARSLRPDDALSSAISPSSRPSQLKEACAEIPLPDALAHVKRVRKADDGDDRLRLVVCIASSSSSSSSFDDDRDVPDAARALVTRHALPPLERDTVPAHAPRTREQWEAWNARWPISWKKPMSHLAEPAESPSAADAETMRRWTREAIDDARCGSGSGGGGCGVIANAVVIVDPASGRVVARGRDATGGWRIRRRDGEGEDEEDARRHPLRHAVLDAIDAAASADLARDPPSSSPPPPPRDDDDDFGGVGEKRRRAPTASLAEMTAEIGRGYLCTGYDVYCAREPCVMCAMALTHSRVRRVIYAIPSARHGALGGGAYSLQKERTLNHHYDVYTFGVDA
jgi:tRNA-specific adenosine deaminase 3